MKKSVIITVSLVIAFSVIIGVIFATVNASGIGNIDYEMDEILFSRSGKSNTTTYFCYDSDRKSVV